VNLLLDGTTIYQHRVDGMTRGMMPFLEDLTGVLAAQAERHDGPRGAVDAGHNTHVVGPPLGIGHVFIQEGLARIVRHAAILEPHKRHELGVFVDLAFPSIELIPFLQLADKGAQICKIIASHDRPPSCTTSDPHSEQDR
jgi:hypothetical protein